MTTQTNDNVIPLVEAVTAHRNRLIERGLRGDVIDTDAVCKINQIDSWLVSFAYQRIIPEHWTSGSDIRNEYEYR